MSFDYNILVSDPVTRLPVGACDHQQSFERYVVNRTDFRTLNYAPNPAINMRAPINGKGTVQIWIHGEEIFPSDPVYGWTVQNDPNRIDATTGDTFYKIVFNRPVRLVLPLIEVSYVSRQGFCMKCSATGYLSDLKESAGGQFVECTQALKLAQKSLKWILTSQCPFYPTFTCTLKSYVGQKLGIQITDTDIQTSIVNALSQMQQVRAGAKHGPEP